jgi:ERCC4-related helicase
MNEHFDGVAFSFDKEKEELIENLNFSSNFATTHHLIEKLETYGYFSHKEIERILKAAISNNQLGWIITDYDISDFMNRVAVPKIDEIRNPDMKELLEKVMAEQQERKANSLSPNVNVEGVTKIDF